MCCSGSGSDPPLAEHGGRQSLWWTIQLYPGWVVPPHLLTTADRRGRPERGHAMSSRLPSQDDPSQASRPGTVRRGGDGQSCRRDRSTAQDGTSARSDCQPGQSEGEEGVEDLEKKIGPRPALLVLAAGRSLRRRLPGIREQSVGVADSAKRDPSPDVDYHEYRPADGDPAADGG